MIIKTEHSLTDFSFWSGAASRAEQLTAEQLNDIEEQLEAEYPDGMEDTELNDFFWFGQETLADMLGFDSWDELVQSNEAEEDE